MIMLLLAIVALCIVMVILEEFENGYTKFTVLAVLLLVYVYLTVIGGEMNG